MTDQHLHTPADELACDEAVEIITDYLEGAMSKRDAKRLERHAETCPGCTEYLEQMRTIAASLGGLTDESLSPEMRDRLLAAFRTPDAAP